jgi:hypothetical protein
MGHSVPNMKVILVVLMAIFGSACGNKDLPLQVIYSSNNCAINDRLLKPIRSESELYLLMKLFPRSFSISPIIKPAIDYQKQSVILVALGQKPSSGYDIVLNGNIAIFKGKILYLPISIKQPDENSLQAQIITSPCRIFSLPKTGFEEIRFGEY